MRPADSYSAHSVARMLVWVWHACLRALKISYNTFSNSLHFNGSSPLHKISLFEFLMWCRRNLLNKKILSSKKGKILFGFFSLGRKDKNWLRLSTTFFCLLMALARLSERKFFGWLSLPLFFAQWGINVVNVWFVKKNRAASRPKNDFAFQVWDCQTIKGSKFSLTSLKSSYLRHPMP